MQVVVGSVVERFADEVAAHADGTATPVEPVLIAELSEIEGDEAVSTSTTATKQPDWSYGRRTPAKRPADRFDDHRAPKDLEP